MLRMWLCTHRNGEQSVRLFPPKSKGLHCNLRGILWAAMTLTEIEGITANPKFKIEAD